jgi:hypothetical protein
MRDTSNGPSAKTAAKGATRTQKRAQIQGDRGYDPSREQRLCYRGVNLAGK